MLDAEEVKKRINKRYESILHCTQSGTVKPYVCLICDEFLKPQEVQTLSLDELQEVQDILTPSTWNAVSGAIARKYMYTGDIGVSNDKDEVYEWIGEMLLSPRGCYVHQSFERKKEGFAVCNCCKMSLGKKMMPLYAIANNFAVGSPPECLLELKEVELAMVTPVKTHGYCFSYTGGQNKQLKGSLSYHKVDMESIARAVSHFDVLNLHENIVVLIHGKMTPKQREIARKKKKIRPHKVLAALKWLIKYHSEWQNKNIDLELIKSKLRDPVLVDNSSPEDSKGNNIEVTESFKVFFPDGYMTSETGGQSNLAAFQEIVNKAKQSGSNVEFQCDIAREAVADFKDNNLVNACLLQFPFGRGGMHELRKHGDGSFTNKMPIEDYIEHLSKVSQPHFQQELFTLILYNISMKQAMVKSAGWKAREKGNAAMFAHELTAEEVNVAITQRRNGHTTAGAATGSQFLSAIDAVTKSVPHTNEAAKRARQDGEAHQHEFGLSHYFLTVTPDDDSSHIIQVYTNCLIDDDI